MVVSLWQSLASKKLVTDRSETVRIIYPGRRSTDSGPDFHDVVIAINNKVVTGDIEIHTDSSHWFSHSHHQNSNYNKTVLHVVWKHNTQLPTILKEGRQIPVVCLSSFLDHPLAELQRQTVQDYPSLPCSEVCHRLSKQDWDKLLNTAGEERFKTKVRRFHSHLICQDARQVLWQGIMRALGYSKNMEPFEKLSQKLPLSFLESQEAGSGVVLRQAWLLGTAGLLPCQRRQSFPRQEATKLERLWRTISAGETMKEADWQFIGVRPSNFPVRRLVALSYLLSRCRKSGLLKGWLTLVKQAALESGYSQLESSLMVVARGYWSYHYDFGLLTKTRSALLGKGKAAEIMVNIILPFVSAWADIAGEPKLKKKAFKLFSHYPELADNEITRHMRQQLRLSQASNRSALEQQGLLHIFTTYCRAGNCHDCPVAHPS